MVRKKIGHLYVGGLTQPYATIKVSKTIRELDNKIIECRLNNNQWELMRERTDKSYPNSYTTVTGKNLFSPFTYKYYNISKGLSKEENIKCFKMKKHSRFPHIFISLYILYF
jgi:hypothetical protein